jgi:hypothetical protein
MLRLLIGGFLVAHGLVHLAVWLAPRAADAKGPDPSHSWLFGSAKGFGVAVAATVAVILVAGGIALFAHAGAWRPITVVGLAGSLLLDIIYFSPWFSFISVVNGAFLFGLVWANWPPQARVGA